MVETDFAAGNAKLFTQRQDFSDVNAGVKPEFIEYISGQAGIEDSGACYFSYGSQILNDDFQKRYDEYFNENYIHQANEAYRKVLELSIRDTKENGYTLALNLYGLDKFPMSYLKIVEGTLDIEKLETGNYAVISKDTVNPNSSFYLSKLKYMDEFHGMINSYRLIGVTLVFVIAVIGIVNLINVFVTSLLERRNEIATLQAIGMTENQLKYIMYQNMKKSSLIERMKVIQKSM